MGAKRYTTIQISQDFAEIIRSFCRHSGRKIAPTTEIAWSNYISSSVSGSVFHVANP